MRRLFACITLLALIVLAGCGADSTPTATTRPATKQTVSSLSHASSPTTVSVPSATHGRPQLGGPVSDFYGKYGQPVGDARPDSTLWEIDSSNAYALVVHYNASSTIVNYITYAGPSDWSKEQYKDFLLTFAPDGTTEDTQTNIQWKNQGGDPYDPIAYTSPSVSKFFLHISEGSGYANIV